MKRWSFLKQGLSPSYVHLCALGFLLFELAGNACFAGVIYEYREENSSTVIGTIEIQSPPASASSGWSTANQSDLIALFLDNGVFGLGSGNLLLTASTFGISGISSLDGVRLDAGDIAITFPTIFPSDPNDPIIDQSLTIQFFAPQGDDSIALATFTTFPTGAPVVADLFIFGDWVAQGTVVVPEPGTLTLLGVGLLGIGGMGYRKRRRSVNA